MIRRGKVGCLDIETTRFDAHYGRIICACIRIVGHGTWTVRTDDKRNPRPLNDAWVVSQIAKKCDSLDMIVTQYGNRFDCPFIRTRALINSEPIMSKIYHRDLWYYSKFKLKLPGNSLQMQHQAMFGFTRKNHLTPEQMEGIIRGDKGHINYTVGHCRKDVLDTEDLYLKYLADLPRHIEKR